MKINSVIVVEGKTDEQRIRQALPEYELTIMTTNGLGFDSEFLNLCKEINSKRGLIVFTDPDGPGMKIRDKINSYLDCKCFNAFINKKLIKNTKKIGIAEAELSDIRAALLENVQEFDRDDAPNMTWDEYLENNFYLKQNRQKIANAFSWSENINAKTLFKWLNFTKKTIAEIDSILNKK